MKENIILIAVLAIIIIILGISSLSEVNLIKDSNNSLTIPNISDISKFRNVKENKFKDYVYALDGSSNELMFPYINLSNVKSINEEIYNLKEQTFNNLNEYEKVSSNYKAFLSNDTLSIYFEISNIKKDDIISNNKYLLYTINLNNQELITYSNLLIKYRLEYNKINDFIKLGIKHKVDYYFDKNFQGDKEIYEKRSIEQFEQDLKDERIQAIITSEKKMISTVNLVLPNYDKYQDYITIDLSSLL